jgi:putative ABC transport system ATP-binding protein
MTRPITIDACELYKGFGIGPHRATVLRGVSLQIARGETVYLVGPSGSGKTTLLSILGCILTPDRGGLRVLGQEIGGLSQAQLTAFRRQHLGFIFQSFNLFPTLSALDNVALALTMRGVGLREATRRAGDLLNQVGLWHRAHSRPAQLSTGECQRVAIARALADDPAVLFADEPTASLDAENGQAVLRLLKRLVDERGVTLVIVTHDNRIYKFADRILHLEDGCLAHEYTPEPGLAADADALSGWRLAKEQVA